MLPLNPPPSFQRDMHSKVYAMYIFHNISEFHNKINFIIRLRAYFIYMQSKYVAN